ncbi:Stealth CR1 domain-containing protein [Aeromonas intestinalis]
MSTENFNVDFVLPWVDGSDPAWLAEFRKYKADNVQLNNASRYQDWDNLQYIFRAFEKFTPWVNKIFLITWGHLPSWLNIDHPKLVVINHSDYIDKSNLPLFNVNPLEINLHNIQGLSEHFVYFNDDLFILRPLKKNEFFKDRLPVDFAIMDATHDGLISHIVLNDIDLINKNFNRHVKPEYEKKRLILNNFNKWFNIAYGWHAINNIIFLKWKGHTGFIMNHFPTPYLKSTFLDVWDKEDERMKITTASKFRSNEDVNQYLFRYWQLVTGQFYPARYNKWKKERVHIEIRTIKDAERIAKDIDSGKFSIYCINDAIYRGRYTKEDMSVEDFLNSKKIINLAFERLLPEKSLYEK